MFGWFDVTRSYQVVVPSLFPSREGPHGWKKEKVEVERACLVATSFSTLLPIRTNTAKPGAKRAPNMPMHHRHVSVLVCSISILWNFHTNPYHPSETTSGNNRVTVPVKPQLRQITSCRARAGQHARRSHKHCKPCAKHAHAPWPRACTCLHDFHLVEFSHQPVPSQ